MPDCDSLVPRTESASDRLTRMGERAEAQRIPLRGLIETTFRCPLRCAHCYCCEDGRPIPAYAGREGPSREGHEGIGHEGHEELSTDAWKRVLDDLAAAGCLELVVTGGEPLVRPDWAELLAHAVRDRFAVTLFTGGTLIDAAAADRIAGLGLVTVEMTMHAADRRVFESIARVPGSYDRFLRGVELLRERGVPLLLKCVLMRANAEAYGGVADFARAVGARVRYGVELSPRNDGDARPLALRMTGAQTEAWFRSDVPGPFAGYARETPEAMRAKTICAAGTTTFAINPYGDVFPCNQLLIPVGNVRERPFRSIWLDAPSPFLERLRGVRTFGDLPGCAGCTLAYACRRCHGVAHLETGDWLAKSPLACEMAGIMDRIAGGTGERLEQKQAE